MASYYRNYLCIRSILAILFISYLGVNGFYDKLVLKSRLMKLHRINAGKPVDVTFQPAGKIITAEQGDLIKDVAVKAGVFIPFKCKQGRCLSCEVRLNGKGIKAELISYCLLLIHMY